MFASAYIYAKSLIAKSMSGRRTIRLCERRLIELCREAGSELSNSKLHRACKLNARWVSKFNEFRRVARRDLDNKAFHDRDKPRIARARASRPIEVVFGDVHPGDIYVPAPGGKGQLRLRLIAWMDDRSRYVWVTVAILGPGNGIRQNDIADSFYSMVADPHGGLPSTLYLDNGGEYGAIGAAMSGIPGFSDLLAVWCTIRALPYNGPAKGAIEGFFANFEQGYLRHLPGWIGGDRTNKKTHAVGKPVRGFDQGLECLVQKIADAVAAYNDDPQQSGMSPRDMLRAAVEQRWKSVGVNVEAFDFAISRQDTKTVKQGAISFKNKRYYCDGLAKLGAGTEVEVRIPLRSDAKGVFVLYRGERLGRAYPDTHFYPTDRAGAKEQARRGKIQNASVSALKAQIDPSIDPHEEQVRFADRSPILADHGAIIRLDETADETAHIEDDDARRALGREFLAFNKPEKREASG